MKIGPFELSLRKKEIPSFVAPVGSGWFFDTHRKGPVSDKEALQSVVGWAFACIDAIASRAASIPYHLFRAKGDEKVPVEKHIFYDVWNKPNELFPSWHMRYLLAAHLKAAGKAYWYLYDGGMVNPRSGRGVPKEVWPLMPDKMEKSVKGGSVSYEYHAERGRVELDPDRVLEFIQPNPADLFGAWSPLRAAGYSMDISEFLEAYQWNWFKNGSWFPYALKTDQKLKEGEPEKIRQDWMKKFQQAKNRVAPAVLHSGLDTVQPPMGTDLGLSELDRAIMEKVLAVFRTPKSMVGFSESANKASMWVTDMAWNRDVIQPLLVMVDSVLDQKWLPIYGMGSELTGEFENPVPDDREELRLDVDLAMRHGLITDNEAREKLGDEPIENGDVRYKPFNLMPVGATSTPGGQGDAKQLPSGDASRPPAPISKSFWTPERKDAHWHGVIKGAEAQEKKWRPVMKDLWDRQEEDVLEEIKQRYVSLSHEGWSRKKVAAALKKNVDLDAIDDVILRWEEEFVKKGQPVMRGIFSDAGEAAMELVNVGTSFDLNNPRAVAYLEERAIQFARTINETTAKDIRRILGEGIMEGESVQDLSKRVSDYYGEIRDYRTDRIARTETMASTNAGSHEGYTQAGVEHKQWISARDGQCRESHLYLDRKYSEDGGKDGPIRMDEDFVNDETGSRGPYPLAMSEVSDNINCRCISAPFFPED